MKTISLLGSGWLGLALTRYFQQQSFRVKASTRASTRFDQLRAFGAIPHLVDIDNLSNDIQTFLDCDVLIVNITSKNIPSYIELIRTLEESAVRRVLFVSSTSVYQNTNDMVTESEGLENVDSPLYQIERLFISSPHFETTVVRLAGLIGPGRHPGLFFKNGKLVEQPDSPVNLIHQTDCVNIIGQIIEQKALGEIFNACAGSHPTKRDFYGQAKQSLGQSPPNFGQSNEPAFKIVSNQKLKRVLNYDFVYDDLMNLVSTTEQSAFEI
jgi:nucleoside-diphosphate-sugar epimerase